MEVAVPDEVPIDIRAKLMVCLIHQNVFKPLNVSLLYTHMGAFEGNIPGLVREWRYEILGDGKGWGRIYWDWEFGWEVMERDWSGYVRCTV